MDNPEAIVEAMERARTSWTRRGEARFAACHANSEAARTARDVHAQAVRRVSELSGLLRNADTEGDIIAIAEELVRTEDEMRRLGRIHDVIVAARAS